MKQFVTGTLLLLLMATGARSQPATTSTFQSADLIPAPGILGSSISNLHAEGDSLWVGPFLSLTTDGGRTWLAADADSLFGTRNRLYSIDVEGDVIWAGLGTNLTGSDGRSVQSAAGFLYSEDGGRTFTYRFPQLDAPGDSVVQYGISTLKALPVIVPEQSPPFDIDYDPATGTVWVAGWASGLRKSMDQGRTWQRVVLPPDPIASIEPGLPYQFELNPRGSTSEGSYNHTAFSVLVDETGTIWAGTPMGVNVSFDGGESWVRTGFNGTPAGLTGSWVVSIEEQPLPDRNPIWMATWNAGELGENGIDGVSVSFDGGQTFEQALIGVTTIDFAFQGETVYVAGRREGLFISEDLGTTWQNVRHFYDRDNPDLRIRPDIEVNAVAVTSDAVWVGTNDGLFKSTDNGRTWTAYLTEVPLHPEQPSDMIPDVETFAYPNPFSPGADHFVRIRFEVDNSSSSEIRIYDFAMNLVRRLNPPGTGTGTAEVTWDGTDDDGLRVANGPYFYAVRVGNETSWGKILVLE